MVRRRDLLKASLSVCGCATCGALGLGVSGGSARADGPTAISGKGYELWFIGAQRETIMNGKLAAALDLKTLAGRTHLYGLGPIEQVRGEVTIADSCSALAHVAPDGTVNVTVSAGLDAEKPMPLLVTGREDLIEYHILNRIGDPPHNIVAHKQTRAEGVSTRRSGGFRWRLSRHDAGF